VEWAVLGLFILFLIVTYIVVQGTRAALAWRKAAAEGDVKVIRDIVEDSLGAWRSMKRPKEVPEEVWRGIQSMQIVEVDAELVRVSCQAEGDYRLLNGRWMETANPLREAMAVAAKGLDVLLYELPHYKPGRVQIDAYMTMREADHATERVCILSTTATRDDARRSQPAPVGELSVADLVRARVARDHEPVAAAAAMIPELLMEAGRIVAQVDIVVERARGA